MFAPKRRNAQLDSLPNELVNQIGIDLPPTDLAALSLSCKTLEAQLGKKYENLSIQDRKAFLRILEKDYALVYCPWCNKLHQPEKSVPLEADAPRYCQSTTWAFNAIGNNNFPSRYHPNLFYAVGKYRKEGRDETALTDALKMRPEYFNYGPYSRVLDWSYDVNDYGVFVAKRDTLQCPLKEKLSNKSIAAGTLTKGSPSNYCAEVFVSEHVCQHNHVTIRDLLNPDKITVKVTAFDRSSHECDGGTGQVHGCKQCNLSFRVDITPSVVEPGKKEVVIRTWYYLGLGKSPEDIAAHQRDPTYREFREGGTFTRGDVAKFSKLFEEVL